jgi:hypothetical protein
MQGRRARDALFWELAVGWKWRGSRAISVQSHRLAGVRRWGWWLNGQGSRGGCASEVLGVSPARVREREGQGESVRSGSGACPDRHGRSGLGWLGGVGAREREWPRLGNMRGAEAMLRAFAWSERQRGSGELEVSYLGGFQSKGEERGLGYTHGAIRWGRRVDGLQIPAW